MPFGICNAPATFERLMDRVKSGLVGKGMLIYFDDIIVYAPTVMAQFRLMEEVFNRLKTAGLKLNPTKYQLFYQETTFLGHVVSKRLSIWRPGRGHRLYLTAAALLDSVRITGDLSDTCLT